MLIGIRTILRQQNLYDTTRAKPAGSSQSASSGGARYLAVRTADGTYNDLDISTMGSAWTRFGRNVPLKYAYPDNDTMILTPNPRTVSLELLARDTFKPATILNLLAAAWIQFQIHDWLSHGKNQKENPWKIPLADDDPWPEHPMTILRTHSDTTRSQGNDGLPPTYLNTATHWWDGFQI
jgi:hypothetical protein